MDRLLMRNLSVSFSTSSFANSILNKYNKPSGNPQRFPDGFLFLPLPSVKSPVFPDDFSVLPFLSGNPQRFPDGKGTKQAERAFGRAREVCFERSAFVFADRVVLTMIPTLEIIPPVLRSQAEAVFVAAGWKHYT